MRLLLLLLISTTAIAAGAVYVPVWSPKHTQLHRFAIPKTCSCDSSGTPHRCHPGVQCVIKAGG